MIPLLNRAGRLGAVGVVLLANSWPVAWSQTPGATTPSSAHVHGLRPSTLSNAGPSANPGQLSPTWQDANGAVGQFQRGHIDLLRWEQQNTPPLPPEPALVTGPSALTLDAAQALALQAQPQWLLRPGMSGPEQAEQHTRLQDRVLQVRRAWTAAVADQQSARYSRQVLSAAEAGAELAERMARIGNFSRARQMQEELILWDARARLKSADLQAHQSLQNLWQLLGQSMSARALAEALPGLPELPKPVLAEPDKLEQQALAAHPQWAAAQTEAPRLLQGQAPGSLTAVRQALAQSTPQSRGETVRMARMPTNTPWNHSTINALQSQLEADAIQRQIRADVRVAHAALHSALTHAAQSRQEVLRLHTALQQESLLRYNGMLSSTWDLLASARQRIQSVDAAHQAQRQAWLAWADLQAVISGLPYTGRPGAATSPSSPQPAGH